MSNLPSPDDLYPATEMKRPNQMRWWTPRCYPHEPKLLHHLLGVGLLVTVVGFFSAVGVWLWRSHEQAATWDYSSRCACQLAKRSEKVRENAQKLSDAEERKKVFHQALQDRASPYFAMARQEIQTEEKISKNLNEIALALEIQSLPSFTLGLMSLLVPTLALSFMAGRLMLKHAYRAGLYRQGETELTGWARPYWLLAVLPFAVNVTREIKTSIVDIDKSWFGWSSFCICPTAWFLLTCVMSLGVFMVIAYPASIIWCLSRTSYCPAKLDPNANDGAWSVGSYVLFLQTWSIVVLVCILFPLILWLKVAGSSDRLSLAYLTTAGALLLIVSILECRLIANAIRIRLRYYEQLRHLGATWSAVREQDPPEDPTSAFLGGNWWSLPAMIVGTLAVLWEAVQWSGVNILLVHLIAGSHQ